MKVIKPHIKEIVFHIPEGYTIETWIERAGRTCYKSEDRITKKSAPKFVEMLRDRGHWAMIEHCIISVVLIADRGMTHELVRHRLCSYAQESTRFCNYSKAKFNNEITIIEQPNLTISQRKVWARIMKLAENGYFELIEMGVKSQIARSVLPIGIKSEIVCTANLRQWNQIFQLRCDTSAHPIIRGLFIEILREFNNRLPSVYEETAERFLE